MEIRADEFCSDDTRVPDLPFVRDDPAIGYATDTCIAIRFEARLYSGEWYSGDRRKPKIDEVLHPCESITDRFPLPELPACAACGGRGEITSTCPECGGSGNVICDLDHEHDCDNCDGTGDATDRCCKVKIGNREIVRKYANKLALLPNLMWGVESDNPKGAVFFWFDGGCGAVMPVAVKDKP